MKTSTYRYVTQIMSLEEENQNDDAHSYFPNIYETILMSQPFDNHKACVHACDIFLKDKVNEINSSTKSKYGIVWEFNPKYKAIILGENNNTPEVDNTTSWKPDELVKYHIVKMADLKKKKTVTSILVSTISIEPGEVDSISVH